MYIRKSTRTYNGKTYTNHLLVESVQTAKGPRQRTICSLGSLEPAPAEDWLGLAHKLQSALQGQESLSGSSTEIQEWVEKARNKKKSTVGSDGDRSTVTVEPDQVQVEQAREAGPVHVGHQLWGQLEMNRILQQAGLSARACRLTEVMTLNRLICPSSEHAMPDWIRRTALGDILQEDFSELADEALYRNLDRLHPNREAIERALAEKEKTLFNLDDTVYLYDLTSTYFEGQATANPQAKRGYSRDKRPDCKQVVVGLVVDRDGFPKAHQQRVAKGRLKRENKIQRAIGRLLERYPRVARYYELSYDTVQKNLSWNELSDKKATAKKLDGSYVLKTDRQDLTADEIWRTYILLTRVEDAFRDIKSPLMERPIFHHLQNRTQTHIFLC